MIRSLTLELHVLPGIATGGWCPRCSLPSAWTVRWVLADTETLRVEIRGSHTACDDCGWCVAEKP